MSYKTAFWFLVLMFICYAFKKQAEINHIYIEEKIKTKKTDSAKVEILKNVQRANDSLCKYWDEKNWTQ